MSSSASDHDPASEHNENENESESTSESDGSGSSHTPKIVNDDSEAQYYRQLLTEESVKMHEVHYPPMTTQDRITFWDLAGDFSEIEDDFDDRIYSSKPIRSERVSSYVCLVFMHFLIERN